MIHVHVYNIQEVLSNFKATSHFPQPFEEEIGDMPRMMSLVKSVLKDKQMQKVLKEKVNVQESLQDQLKVLDRQMTKDFDFCLNSLKVSALQQNSEFL
jgi:hypothetical protein